MSAQPNDLSEESADRLSPFEANFVHTVLEHRGIFRDPSERELAAALDMLQLYDSQCQANPGYEVGYAPILDDDDMGALRAKAYLMFETIQPTPAQWHKAHIALYGPSICETCG